MKEKKDWNWFKELVKKMRKQNDELIREQGGSNHVMLSISLVDYDINDWIDFYPHGINLHTGKCSTFVNGIYRTVDVKKLFITERSGIDIE